MSRAASQGAPAGLAGWGEALSDRLNPMVVKEVRQGLRTRAFAIFFGLLLVASFLTALGFVADFHPGDARGPAAFTAFFVGLGLIQFFVIPYSAYRSMAREREDETWVLLTLTGLGARRILLGKLGSALLQGALYSSAAAPFLLFSYYLNGIDLPTIVVAMAASVAYQAFLVGMAISVATLAEVRVTRALQHFVLLGVLLIATGVGIGASSGLVEEARELWARGAFWLVAGAITYGFASTGVLFFQLAVSRLSLPTEEYARGPRLALLVQLAGLAGLFVLAYVVEKDEDFLVVGAVGCAIYLAVVGTGVTADRDGMTRGHWETGHRWALLKPGALRGMLLLWVALVVTGGLFVAVAAAKGDATDGRLAALLSAPALALLYTSAAQVVARWVRHHPSQTALLVRVAFLGLVALGGIVPPLLGSLVSRYDDPVLNTFNPALGLHGRETLEGLMGLVVLLWVVALLVAAWAFVVLWRRDREVGP